MGSSSRNSDGWSGAVYCRVEGRCQAVTDPGNPPRKRYRYWIAGLPVAAYRVTGAVRSVRSA